MKNVSAQVFGIMYNVDGNFPICSVFSKTKGAKAKLYMSSKRSTTINQSRIE